MGRSPTNLVIAALASLLLAGTAAAQAEPAGESGRGRALDLLEESAALYREGRFAEAATLLRRAHELHPSPALLYNLGRALEGAGDAEGALEAYEGYLDSVEEAPGESERRADAEARAEALRAAQAPPVDDAEEEVDVAMVPPPERPVAPWIVLGGGLALTAGGLLTGLRASDRHRVADDPDTALRRAVELQDRAERLAISANVLMGVGGAMAIAGLTWGLVVRPRDDGPTVALGPLSVQLSGHF